jgi:DMSO/TMAO reductase YedYZ molybdopterin-dependent catalytic subunit
MAEPIISRGFFGRRPEQSASGRVPPGQFVTTDFPVLSAGPTPRVPLASWDLQVRGALGQPRRWSWEEFQALPHEEITVDIHCVTKWSKLDTHWSGVAVDALLTDADPQGAFVTVFAEGGYTTNLPLEDLSGGRAWIVDRYEGASLHPEHGGPARLLVPHLYFWKSAKWVRGLELTREDRRGFWEQAGYHNRGDPWKEQRYWGD